MSQRRVVLNDLQRQELQRIRETAPKAYLRERAAAILLVADGKPAAAVARSGLPRYRKADTVYDWLNRYTAEGIGGLRIRNGRGRKQREHALGR